MARIIVLLAAGLFGQTVRLGELTQTERAAAVAKPGVQAAGAHRVVSTKMLGKGKWRNGVWRLQIVSKGATGLRLHVTGFADGKLMVRGAAKETGQPFVAKGPNGDGDFWTGVVAGESVWVEFTGTKRAGPPIGIAAVSHLW